MITQEQYKLIENALCELKNNNENIYSYGDGYDDAIDEAIEQVKSLTIHDVVGRSEQLACIHHLERLRLIGGNITCLDCQSTWVRKANLH